MRRIVLPLSGIVALSLGACSGGGAGAGGVAGTPTPTASPSPTSNTTLADLRVSQSFPNDANGMKLALDLTTKTGISGTQRPNALSVSYDAASRSYTVTADGRTQSFGQSEIQTNTNSETIYTRASGSDRDYLTLVKVPYTGTTATRYVGLAYWQHNVVASTQQDMDFYIFTYGLATAAAAIPRTGTAAFSTDMFGAVSTPGQEPRSFSGRGDFNVDFGAGVFATHSYLGERTLVTNQGVSGGSIEFTGSGQLSSTDGSFSGNALYKGWFGAAAGALNGRFYGPGAEELGASFSGSNAAGMTVVGGFTGQRDTSLTPANLTLANMTKPQLFYAQFGNGLVGQLNWQNSETFTFSPPTSDLYGGQFTVSDKVASTNPNFTTYRKSFSSSYDTQNVTLELYKPGSGNTELALSYATFAHWSTSVPFGTGRSPVDLYAAYGLETPNGLLAAKTGTGHYAGVVYGTGSQLSTGGRWDVKGSSIFDVNFGAQNYTGSLSMAGTSTTGGANVDFGSFAVAGRLTMTGVTGTLTRGGSEVGAISPRFFGPDGQEIAAPFNINVPAGGPGAGIAIMGATVAKRQ